MTEGFAFDVESAARRQIKGSRVMMQFSVKKPLDCLVAFC